MNCHVSPCSTAREKWKGFFVIQSTFRIPSPPRCFSSNFPNEISVPSPIVDGMPLHAASDSSNFPTRSLSLPLSLTAPHYSPPLTSKSNLHLSKNHNCSPESPDVAS
ncbi:unnamed protein product [Linum trigynum]|uniref:Uncharacterized protein n=1 Tax=Linum trigynum TaxID=586398 RepID=A0AAV2D7Y1_9ROSI